MSLSSAGRAASSSGCVARPRGHEIGLSGFAVQIRLSSLTGSYVMATAEHREPYESRGSRTVLGAPGGESPPGDSPKADVHRTRDGIFAPPPRADIRAGSRQVRYGPGGATRRPPTCQTQAARLSRLRDACILRLTRPLLRERLFRCGVPAYEEELA